MQAKPIEAMLRLRNRGWGLTTYLIGNIFVHAIIAFSAKVDPQSLGVESENAELLFGMSLFVVVALFFIWSWKAAGVFLLYPLLITEIIVFQRVGIESTEVSQIINILIFTFLALKKFPYFSGNPTKIKELSDYEQLTINSTHEQSFY